MRGGAVAGWRGQRGQGSEGGRFGVALGASGRAEARQCAGLPQSARDLGDAGFVGGCAVGTGAAGARSDQAFPLRQRLGHVQRQVSQLVDGA